MKRLHMNEIRELIYRLRRGDGKRKIAREMKMSRNTVRKYHCLAEEHQFLDPDKDLPSIEELAAAMIPPLLPRQSRSSVEPYEEIVRNLLEQRVEKQAIWQRLQQVHDYSGSYTSVCRFAKRILPAEPNVVCRIETAAGEEAQVDFGYAGLQWDSDQGKSRKAWVFVMVLSHSRHQYVECVFDQKIATWLSCHEHAFNWFGGVPQKVILDNLKSGVLQADLHDPVLGEPYRRLAQHYGFVIAPNRVGTPRHKGKVESGVHYVKRNFLAGQKFADLQSLNQRAQTWVMETAGQRIHGTTKEAPLKRFYQVEQEQLQALPSEPFDLLMTWQGRVQRDCHVHVDGCYYSVPCQWVGKIVDVYVGRRLVEIYYHNQLLSTHSLLKSKGERSTRIEHYPKSKRHWMENPPKRCRERAQSIGVCCYQLVDVLLNDPVQDRLRNVQSLLRLQEKVGKERLEKACQRAVHYGDPSYRRVQRILNAYLDQQPLEEEKVFPQNTRSYCFARPGDFIVEQEVELC